VIAARRARDIAPVLLLLMLTACGKKGPPLPPLQLVPSRVEDLTVTRRADEVQARLTVPATNEDPKKRTPADISAVEVYALTGKPEDPFGNPLTAQEFLKYATKIGEVAIKPPPKPEENDEDSDKDTEKDKKKGDKASDGKAADNKAAEKKAAENTAAAKQAALKASMPPDPRPGQGEQVIVREAVTPALMTPWVHPKKKDAKEKPKGEEAPGRPLWWPPPQDLLMRVYVAIGVNHSGKKGNQSTKVFLPLSEAPQAPEALEVKYDASALTVSWTPPSDARIAIQRPPETGELTAKPIVEGSGVTTYNVYDAKALDAAEKAAALRATATSAATAATNAGAKMPAPQGAAASALAAAVASVPKTVPPLNPTPISTATFTDTRLVFGEERCYTIRAVLLYGGARLESPTTKPTCVTPKDTFPPSAPKNLSAVGSEGGVSLIWEADSEADLDGYLVLRGELKADGTQPEKLSPITPEPIHETTYRDSKARPGVRYVYAIVAVDKATPRNVSDESNRVEESAR
jgi:predicted small lipoprotein YifL